MNEFIYGRRNAIEYLENLLQSGENPEIKIKEIFYKGDIPFHLQNLIDKLSNINRSKIERKDLDKIVDGKNHQGIVIELKASGLKKQRDLHDFNDFIKNYSGIVLLLDRIQDAGNLGNILRTAECMGVTCIVIPDRDACDITDTVTRISSGAVHHLQIFKVSNLRHCLDTMKKNGFWIVATDEDGDENPDLQNLTKIGLIMGNEKDGIKRILMDESDFKIKIPMRGHISSLNVAVTTGILLDRLINRK